MNENEEVQQQETAVVQYEIDDIDQLIARAEKMSRSLDKLKQYALTLTKPKDWCMFGETLHMTVKAAQDIAAKLGVSWPEVKFQEIPLAENGYAYIYTGQFEWFGRTISAQGKASSNKPFFSQRGGEKIPVDEVDRPNVMQAAYSNLVVNGVRRITGLHNLTLEDLKENKIDTSQIPNVSFKQDFKAEAIDEQGRNQLRWINEFLIFLVGDDKKAKQAWLKDETAWKDKSGKEVPGRDSLAKLTAKQIPYVYKSARDLLEIKATELLTKLYENEKDWSPVLKAASAYEENDETIVGTDKIKEMSSQALCQTVDKLQVIMN